MPGLDGTRLGHYRLQRRLGRGGMSEVYLATDELTQRDVAVKVVSSIHGDYVDRFRREAEAIGNLHHNHILPAYDFGEQLPWHYLVMRYVDYCTLLDVLAKGPLSLEYAAELLEQIASGLQYAHDHGVVHRDIKPSNILLRDDHYAYLADFGLAKPLQGADKVTQTGVLLGTPEYMAPELADSPATKSSDMYALGILLYQMVTGRTPFSGESALSIYLKQMREQPIPPSRINPSIPRAVDMVILRALEKDPRRRYDSATALVAAYKQAIAGEQIMPIAAPSSPAQHMRPVSSPYETEEMQRGPVDAHIPPAALPALEPIEPVMLPQPQKLVLPPREGIPVSQGRADPPRNGRRAAREPSLARPAHPARYIPRRVSARRASQGSRYSLAFLIALSVLVVFGTIFYLVYSSLSARSVSNNRAATPGITSATQTPASNFGATATAHAVATQQAAQATATAQAAATQQAALATATAITRNTPLFSDSMSASDNHWPDDGSTCVFSGGSYHVLVNQQGYLQPCPANALVFNNGGISLDVTLLQGSDAGFILRANNDQFYDFEITGQREYFFRRHDAGAGANYVYLLPKTASNLVALNSKNTLLIIARGADFNLYLNGSFLKEVQDNTFSSGQIALVAGTYPSINNADASFSNINVYPLSPA